MGNQHFYFRTSYSEFGSILLFSLIYSGIQLFGGFFAVVTYLLLKWRGKCKSLVPNDEDNERNLAQTITGLQIDEQINHTSEKSEHLNGVGYLNPAYKPNKEDSATRL